MNSQVKSITIQWIGPTAILMLTLVIMLFNFSTKSQVAANTTVTRNIIVTAENGARSINDEVALLEKVGKPIAEILSHSMGGKKLNQDLSYEIELLEIAIANSNAYMAYICDGDGNAVNNEGKSVSIAETDYYDSLKGAEGVRYHYTLDDGAEGKDAIILLAPILEEGGNNLDLLLFYDIGNIETIVKKYDFNIWNLETLIDRDGNIIASYGSGAGWKQGENIFDALAAQGEETVKKLRSQINGSASSVISAGSDRSLVYTPLGAGGWTVILGVSQSYIDRQVEQQWAPFKNMMFQVIIVLCVFIFFIVFIAIVNKLYNSKKQDQLETKADTDLLTGLNNKLATERKIKEFIAHNPNSQSMMLIFDIDNFKKINDTMGHAFGDEVLRSLGQQIRVIFRASDIVGRAGGDEFIVFLKNINETEAIRKEAKKVEDFFKDFKAGEYTKYSATASIGAAIFPHEGADFESIYKAADSALYKAKKRGKNQLAFYNEEWAAKPNSQVE